MDTPHNSELEKAHRAFNMDDDTNDVVFCFDNDNNAMKFVDAFDTISSGEKIPTHSGYSREGLTGIFIVDQVMTIRSVCVKRREFAKYLRYSSLRLLSWLQRTAMISDGALSIKEFFRGDVSLTEEVHNKIFRYYLRCKYHRCDQERPIIPNARRSQYASVMISSSRVLVSETNGVDSFYVEVKINGTSGYIPIDCISDL